jgi:hypothetical protein
MIRILDNPNKQEFVAVCKLCSCKFTFEQIDLHRHTVGSDFVWCPNCKHEVVVEQLIEYKRPEPKPVTVSRKTRYGGWE